MYQDNPGNFKNEASRRFYIFFKEKFDTGVLSKKEVGPDFDLGESYTYGFWDLLKKGKVGVSLDQVNVAAKKYNLNPLFVFGYTDIREITDASFTYPAAAAEDDSSYQVSYSGHSVGKVIDEVLEKHKIPRTQYAEKQLKMTPRNLQRIMAGEVQPSFILVSKIAEDTGESLDMFRSKPLPKGHMLQLLKEREERISEQARTIAILQKTVEKLSA